MYGQWMWRLSSPSAEWSGLGQGVLPRPQDEEISADLRDAEERLAAARAAFAEEVARRWRPPPALVSKLRQAVQRAFDGACGELTAKHGALVRLDRRNTYTLEHRCLVADLNCRCLIGRNASACCVPTLQELL